MSEQHLVLQGINVTESDIATIAALVCAEEVRRVKPNVYRLTNAIAHTDVEKQCASRGLDYGFVSPDLTLSDIELVALDMDSTLINIESLDEVADFAGVKDEVTAITQKSMQGEVDFTASLRQRVALLKGLDIRALEQVYNERLKLNPGAEQLIATLQSQGIKTMLVSGGFTYFTERLKKRLKLDHAFANELEIVAGRLTGNLVGEILDGDAKARHVREICRLYGIDTPATVLAIGDGANDQAMLSAAGIGIAYRAKTVLRQQASYRIDHVGLDGVLNLFAS